MISWSKSTIKTVPKLLLFTHLLITVLESREFYLRLRKFLVSVLLLQVLDKVSYLLLVLDILLLFRRLRFLGSLRVRTSAITVHRDIMNILPLSPFGRTGDHLDIGYRPQDIKIDVAQFSKDV